MGQTIDIQIDAGTGTLLQAGAARLGSLPVFTRNDAYDIRLRLQQASDSGSLRDLDLTGSTLRLGIGSIDAAPTEGEFKLAISAVTSSAISYNSTAVSLYTAISGIAGTACTVADAGDSAWIITSATAGSAITFSGVSFTLFPSSSVVITPRRAAASGIKPQYLVRLLQGPAAYCDSFVASSTAGVVTMSVLQNGSVTQNEIYQLTVGSDAIGGAVGFSYAGAAGPSAQLSTDRGVFALNLQTALNGITALSGGITVDGDNSGTLYLITFVNALGLTNITTALNLDASGVQYAKYYASTLTMATAEVLNLFASGTDSTVATTLEVELTESGKRRTVYQGSVYVKKDVIVDSSYAPVYY